MAKLFNEIERAGGKNIKKTAELNRKLDEWRKDWVQKCCVCERGSERQTEFPRGERNQFDARGARQSVCEVARKNPKPWDAVITSELIHASRELADFCAFVLAACGQSEPPAKSEAGPPGSAGPPGPPGPAGRPDSAAFSGSTSGANGPVIKVIARPCDQPACGASCEENEQILNAYALNPGGAISFIDQRNATFRPQKRPSVFALICVGK